jgi:hypothetical protein
MSNLCTRLAAGCLLAATTGSAPAHQETVRFGCDAGGNDTCYFSIRDSSGGTRDFTMHARERGDISGVFPGSDMYMVSINQSPPNDPSNCGETFWCKSDMIKMGYNN